MLKSETIGLFCTGANALTKQEPQSVQTYLQQHYQLKAIYQTDTYRILPAKERAEIFLEYLLDPKISILWALRGGEGTADTIPFIHKHSKKIKTLAPKPLIGFSDITPLLIYFNQIYQWPTIHGPGAIQTIKHHISAANLKIIFNCLLGKQKKVILSHLNPLNSLALESKLIKGNLIGGNLSLLNISIGDLWEIETKNKIIIIEEVNEKPHVVRRTLHYLQRLGKFDDANAILFGDFSYPAEPKLQPAIQKVLRHFAEECSIPVLKTHLFGHGKYNLPLQFSKKSILDLTTLTLINYW
ncbi:MAG: hypothetical protein A3E87_06995 [Gammaproteobacteria bacterium RIFCSPHIGHO2_12_FULL_35_23]|nr:MAG: hypothetical protein A3E87_06995 [Gammaproteobacteria bacterium RIFCSPHIGHO2_12_FULL_35_23]